MDLIQWHRDQSSGISTNHDDMVRRGSTGVGSISNRSSKKPLIAAVNGFAVGGGLEMVLNCDVVIASEGAKFGFPEVSKGVTISAGGA